MTIKLHEDALALYCAKY